MDEYIFGIGKELYEIQDYVSSLNYYKMSTYDYNIQIIMDSILRNGYLEENDFLNNKSDIFEYKVLSDEESTYIDERQCRRDKYDMIDTQNVVVDEILFYEQIYNIVGIDLPDDDFDRMVDYYYNYYEKEGCSEYFFSLFRALNRYAVSIALLTNSKLDIKKYYYCQKILELFNPLDAMKVKAKSKVIDFSEYRNMKGIDKKI